MVAEASQAGRHQECSDDEQDQHTVSDSDRQHRRKAAKRLGEEENLKESCTSIVSGFCKSGELVIICHRCQCGDDR